MDVQRYLDRVGFEGEPRADLDTLTRIHRGHLLNIPYENLDVLRGRTLDFDIARIFDKLVTRERGGWCYEMNGLMGWALEALGFEVTRMAGGVVRATLGDGMVGNHLVLKVALDEPYVADVGFGDGLFEPTPLRAGPIMQRGFRSQLEHFDDGWWRYHNHQNGGAPSFDFRAEAADPAVLAERCAYLQTSQHSPFTQNVVLQRHFPDRIEVMRNAMRLSVYPDRAERRVLANADEFAREMREVFGIDLPGARSLWPLAERRGREMLAESAG